LKVVTFIHCQLKTSEVQAEMRQKLAGNPFRGLTEAAIGSIQVEWGCGVWLVAGEVMVVSGLRDRLH
jgi:hypothetical protein